MKIKNEVVEAAQKAHALLKQKLNEYSVKIKDLISKLQEQAINLRAVAFKNVASTEKEVSILNNYFLIKIFLLHILQSIFYFFLNKFYTSNLF